MSLAGEYKQQFGWRDWPTIFDALPSLQGQTVLDLGCVVVTWRPSSWLVELG
jgi:hypothetical protein